MGQAVQEQRLSLGVVVEKCRIDSSNFQKWILTKNEKPKNVLLSYFGPIRRLDMFLVKKTEN